MWVSKRKIQSIEKRLTNLEVVINRWQAHDSEESERMLRDVIAHFQGPNGAIRGSVPESS